MNGATVLGNVPYPTPASSVHVWCGYRAAGSDPATFLQSLGETFIPSAAIMQPTVGLRAYIAGVFSSDALPSGVPEETALLFWDSPAAYAAMKGTLSGRVYTNTHWQTYDMSLSSAQFPSPVTVPLAVGTPYMVLDQTVDWMTGTAFQLLVATSQPPDLSALGTWAQGVAASPPAGLQGAYLLVGATYIAWWESWTGEPSETLRADLAAFGTTVANGPNLPAVINAPFEEPWGGISVQAGDLLNVQFNRPTPLPGGTS